ncbi:MAG: NAD(P)/FAD-dependent oxidoreductase [Pseudomonadota bacterium]
MMQTILHERAAQHALLSVPVGKPGSGGLRYAAAMHFYANGDMSAQMLEMYRRCSKFDDEDPVDLARYESVGIPDICRETPAMTLRRHAPSVVVIGAGVAGLAAAQALRNAGARVLVLEAADHSGGRCVTDHRLFSQPFDRGGSWLHSAAINPLARLAETLEAQLHKGSWSPTWIHALGHELSAAEVAEHEAYQRQMWDSIFASGARDPVITAQDAAPDGAWRDTALHFVAQVHAGDAGTVSAADCALYDDGEGDWLVGGGLGAFMKSLTTDVPVQVNAPVQSVDWSGPGVTVTTPVDRLTADAVLITVSTGVLASGAINFIPALPAEKTAAAQALPMGLLNKIGIEMDPGWAQASQGQMIVYHKSDDLFCTILFGVFGSGLAVGFVGGRCADALEAQGEGAATALCLEAMSVHFGADVQAHVRGTAETAWRSNQWTRGSYSYGLPGSDGARDALAQPIGTQVYFAGEATIAASYATVHGAYLSGRRAARQIMEHHPVRAAAPDQERTTSWTTPA